MYDLKISIIKEIKQSYYIDFVTPILLRYAKRHSHRNCHLGENLRVSENVSKRIYGTKKEE
jgi:hypothetical protein